MSAGQPYLGDAMGLVALAGESSLFLGLNSGDLICVEVSAAAAEELRISELRKVYSSRTSDRHRPKPHVVKFAEFVQAVREFFLNRGLTEILTPTLVKCPGLEPALEPFSTTISQGRESLTIYLPTSPEVSLKKAMSRGYSDIFEIKNCFRREEFSPHHESEFLMLEWYRSFANLEMILSDLEQLLAALSILGFGAPQVLHHTDFATLFAKVLQFNLTPQTTAPELRDLCLKQNIETAADDTFADLFHRLLIERIEPALQKMGPTTVRRFPPSMAALAKLDGDGWADRVEFYWNGLEIANGFNEVTDPSMQAERWREEAEERRRLGRSAVPEDPDLIQALEKGLPPSGGIALGLERLYMACMGVTEIRELRLFGSSDLFA